MFRSKSFRQKLWDFLGIPFRLVLFDQKWLTPFGWTTLEEERINAALPLLQGRVLDIGAGPNTLINRYRQGVGIDVHDWGGGAMVVDDSANLPFKGNSFDTVTLIACLNHIPNRQGVLQEAKRVLKPGGQLIITMINPILGQIGHAIWWYSEDKKRGGMQDGEMGGMWTKDILRLCNEAGFCFLSQKAFVYRMNNLYIFRS